MYILKTQAQNDGDDGGDDDDEIPLRSTLG